MTDHEWPDPDYGNDGGDLDDLGGADTADLSQPFDGLDPPSDDPGYPDTPDAPYGPDASFDEAPFGGDTSHDASYGASFGDGSYDASFDDGSGGDDDAFGDDFDAPGDGGDPPVGADPDLDPVADHDAQPVFPPALDLDPTPEPVDGFPWADPATLGEAPLTDPVAAHPAAPDPTDLASYAAQDLPPGADPWTALAASEDPATSSLARFWSHPT
ncbi:hypothetical protein K1W54_21540 [Micromonospora sp. CPCC 205371]|nr:hypothetical protein [Micromonospora sp. CPCC 205371]